MNIIEVAQDLIRYKTQTGNTEEIEQLLSYLENLTTQMRAKVKIHHDADVSPVFFAVNKEAQNYDVLILGHLDVVPAKADMFEPKIKDGKLFGRGALDMKSFAAVALNTLATVIKQKIPLKFGIILSTDEEQGSKSLEAFMNTHPNLKANIVLDNDVGGDIYKIVARCKNPVFIKLKAKGKAAHGSTPWAGNDANEKLFQTWRNIRALYPAFSLETGAPENIWTDTLHFATIKGGTVSNIISDEAEALLDFRLIETSNVEELCKNLNECMETDVRFEVISSSTPVVMSETNPHILAYKQLAEQILAHPIDFEYIGGATDSRAFAIRGSTVIMHSGTGAGMHAEGEYVEIESVRKLAEIQIKFLENLVSNTKEFEK